MSKIILDDVTSLNSISVINDNFDKLEAELNDKILYRNPPIGEPNSVQVDVDMNGKRLYNLPKPLLDSEPVRYKDLKDAVLGESGITAGVSSFNTRTGDVVLSSSDVTDALGFTPPSTAVTSFNSRSGAVTLNGGDVTLALTYIPASLASPVFIGTPSAPTATTGTNTTQLATTAFVAASVAAATTGVATFNGRTGTVVPTTGDYTVAQVTGAAPLASPALTGNPTAPTQLSTDNSTRLATTAYVKSLVSTAGVSSFNTRTGAVALTSTDVTDAFCSTAAEKQFIWNSDIAGHANATAGKSIYIQRNATYTPGSAGDTGGVTGAIYLQSFTPPNAHNNYEWGITSEMFSRSTGHTDTINPANGVAPQNVAINGTIWKEGSAPGWGGNFAAHNRYNILDVPSYGTIGIECNVGGMGTDPDVESNGQTTIGLHVAAQTSSPMPWTATTTYVNGRGTVPTTGNGFAYANRGASGVSGSTQPVWPTTIGATITDGTVTWTCIAFSASLYAGVLISGGGATLQYGVRTLAGGGTTASYYSKTTGSFAALFEGVYNTSIYLANATNSSGNAIVIKANDAIAFDSTGVIKVKYDGAGKLQFYNGATKRGYIDMYTGADVSLNAGGGASGVSSFNTRTGAVTLTSGDVTSALGIIPVDTSTNQLISGSKTFNNTTEFGAQVQFNTDTVTYGVNYIMADSIYASSSTVNWLSSGNVFATAGSLVGYIRIKINGSNFKIPYYNT